MTTDSRHAEPSAEEELHRFRNFFHAGPVIVFRWIAAPGWPVEYVSPNVFRLFGVSADDFRSGRVPYATTVHPDDLERVAAEVSTNSASGAKGFDQEYRIVRPSGDVRWLFDHTLVVRDERGQVTHYEGYVLDQSEAMRARLEREELQRKLQQTQKLESLGVLAGGIAHDFNNLLTVIMGNLGLTLAELGADDAARQTIGHALRSAERAAELTRQLLAYSGRARLERRVIDLGTLASEIGALIAASLPKKVRLELELPPGLLQIDADPIQIQQVLMNLVINAAESYGDRPGRVWIRTRRSTGAAGHLPGSAQGEWVELEVRDEGGGMDASTRERMFEPFFSTKAQGRGLGLSAVLGIIRSHGGTIEIDSRPGQGTTARVFLPASNPPAIVSIGNQVSPPLGKSAGNVLVVDDEEAVLLVAERILSAHGYAVSTAANGRLALEVFRSRAGEIDLVLLDLTMPEMGGEETLTELRRVRPDVLVVMTSGYHECDRLVQESQSPPAAFLRKPYTVDELVHTLQRVQEGAALLAPRP